MHTIAGTPCRATRVAADFLDFIAFCRCSSGVAPHPLKIFVSHLPPPFPGGVAPKFGSEKVSRYTGVSQVQLRVSRYTVRLRSGECTMTTIFSTIKCALSKFYCHGVSHEKHRFGRFFLSAPNSPPSQNRKFYFYCRLAVSNLSCDRLQFREIRSSVSQDIQRLSCKCGLLGSCSSSGRLRFRMAPQPAEVEVGHLFL